MIEYSEVFCGKVVDFDNMLNSINCGNTSPITNKRRMCSECFKLQRAYEDGIKFANSQQSEMESKK